MKVRGIVKRVWKSTHPTVYSGKICEQLYTKNSSFYININCQLLSQIYINLTKIQAYFDKIYMTKSGSRTREGKYLRVT